MPKWSREVWLCIVLLSAVFPVAAQQSPNDDSASMALEERTRCMLAVERTRDQWRIWPSSNEGPRPPLNINHLAPAMTLAARDVIVMSDALETQFGLRFTVDVAQRELDRIVRSTQEPERLAALFSILGHDPEQIAECLLRPVWARQQLLRLYRSSFESEAVMPLSFDAWWRSGVDDSFEPTPLAALADLRIPELGLGSLESGHSIITDQWDVRTFVGPVARAWHVAVWTGSEMLLWGELTDASEDGWRYDPVTDIWTPISIEQQATPSVDPVAVWTGSEMVIWGGIWNSLLGDGARYDPLSGNWLPMASQRAPAARRRHTAVWSGERLLIWGGLPLVDKGAGYDPISNTWIPILTSGAPSARAGHSAIWAGDEMIVWGGVADGTLLGDGRRYDAAMDSWTNIDDTGAPEPRVVHTAVWTDSRMIAWGGGAHDNLGRLAIHRQLRPLHADGH